MRGQCWRAYGSGRALLEPTGLRLHRHYEHVGVFVGRFLGAAACAGCTAVHLAANLDALLHNKLPPPRWGTGRGFAADS